MNYIKIFKTTTISSSLIYIIFGILLILMPDAISNFICYAIGALGIIFGASRIINYYNLKKKNIISSIDLIIGISSLVFGMIVIVNPKAFASIIPFIIGIYILIIGYFKLRQSFDLKDNNYMGWKSMMISSIITLSLGIVVVFNPFETLTLIIRVVGIVFVLNNLFDLYSIYKFNK